jgi:hypothetical protein
MLIIETTSNGQRMVRIKKDWHPGRMSSAYVPRRNYVDNRPMERVQAALLTKPH